MDRNIISEKPTTRFLGTCADCLRPLALESTTTHGTYPYADCAECSHPVTLTRLVAVTTVDVCDASCMGAVGPNCSCGCEGDADGERDDEEVLSNER